MTTSFPSTIAYNPSSSTTTSSIAATSSQSANVTPLVETETLTPEQEKFMQAALARLNRQPLPQFQMPNQNDPEFIALAENFRSTYIDCYQGGQHRCYTTNKGYLFKERFSDNWVAPRQSMKPVMELFEKARQACQQHGLYLLQVPQCALLPGNDSVLVVEHLNVTEHEWYRQKAIWRFAAQEPRLEAYIKEVFRQISIFACVRNYHDIKYINNPFTWDALVALVDLDEGGPGLVGNHPHGLFRAIPIKWYDEYTAMATPLINEQFRERS